jgi:acid phosphatase type 7
MSGSPENLPNPDNVSIPRARRLGKSAVAGAGVLVLLALFASWQFYTGRFEPAEPDQIPATAQIGSGPVFEAANRAAVKLTRAPYVQMVTQNTACLVWRTDVPATSQAEIRPANASSAHMSTRITSFSVAARTQQHIVQLRGLKPATRYSYRIGSDGRALASGSFSTAKLPGMPLRIAIWGDSGTASRGQKLLAQQIEKANADFLLHTGDLIYPRGAARDFDPKFFQIYRKTLSRAPFYGSLGNHDVVTKNGAAFLSVFVLPRNGPPGLTPERNYSFDYGDVHVAVVDSNASTQQLRRNIIPWLQADLQRSRALWKFVVFHHPPFSSGLHGDDSRMQKYLVPAIAGRADIAFNGHDHCYERWQPRGGVHYIVTGAGGAALYPKRGKSRAVTFNNDVYSYTLLEIRGRNLRLRQISAGGATIDDWRLQK